MSRVCWEMPIPFLSISILLAPPTGSLFKYLAFIHNLRSKWVFFFPVTLSSRFRSEEKTMPNLTPLQLPYVNDFLHLLVKCTWPLKEDVFNGQGICAVPQNLYLKSSLWSSLPGKLVISNKHQFLLSKFCAWRVLLYPLMVEKLGDIRAVWGHWDLKGGFPVTDYFDSMFRPFRTSLYCKIKIIKCPMPLFFFSDLM